MSREAEFYIRVEKPYIPRITINLFKELRSKTDRILVMIRDYINGILKENKRVEEIMNNGK